MILELSNKFKPSVELVETLLKGEITTQGLVPTGLIRQMITFPVPQFQLP